MANEKDKGKTDPKPEQRPPAPPAPPRPVRLDITSSGENGQYTFDIQVMSDRGCGIKANIRIIEGDRIRTTKETADNGFLEYPAALFKEEEQEFQFSVIGTDLRHEVVLDGPEQPKPPPQEKIKPIPDGFWANFHNADNEYKKRKGN